MGAPAYSFSKRERPVRRTRQPEIRVVTVRTLTLVMSEIAGLTAAAQIQHIARDQDREAFGALFAHFAPRIKAYLLRLGANAAQADDVAQETMLIVWRKAAYFDSAKANAATWIFTIARNRRIDVLRRERYPTLNDEARDQRPDDAPLADETMGALQRQRILRKAVGELPADQADVVRLSFFEDKPHSEIERALGIPLGTVKSRLRLAMTRLRKALGEE
jgi:RNA polymerase sigma-70 factor (ECF subfamily)